MFGRLVIVLAVAALMWAVLVRDTGASGASRTYRVAPGDTLWSIAAESYAGDPREGVWKLQRRNGLADATIVAGQVLVVP